MYCRGLQQSAAAKEGPRSKLARASNGLSMSGRVSDCKIGASAAQAVNLSDDDDDVVIIEEGMQPQATHTHTASAKQSGELLCKLALRSACTHLITSRIHCVALLMSASQRILKQACAKSSFSRHDMWALENSRPCPVVD